MTGFGAAVGDVHGRRARVELRTVNHRWFNLSTRLAPEFSEIEPGLRDALRRTFDRGHVNIAVQWVDPAAGAALDGDRAAETVAALRRMQRDLGLDGGVTLDLVLRHADTFGGTGRSTVSWEVVAPIAAEAIAICQASREGEGAALAAEIAARFGAIGQCAVTIGDLAPSRIDRERERLTRRVGELLDGREGNDAAIAREIAITADRIDITEELVRLRAHLDAARRILGGTAPVGKSLGFLVQEIGREVNTIGSKANDVDIAHAVVAAKGELEKVREQLENLE